jgi:hypothetical protein
MEIFKLVGNIFVDNEKANKNITDTDKKGQGLGKTFQKIGKGALKFGKLLGGAALAGGAAMIALAKKTGDAADRILDLSSITGMTTDEIQKWEKVSTVAGVSMDAITNVSQKLTKQMDILSTGTGKAAEASDALGLSYESLESMNADERMNAVVKALQAVEDPTERAKLGTDLLGNSFADLAPILDVGADKLKNIKDNANIISNEDLNQANEFRIKMDQMKEKAIEFGQGLAVKLMPYLNLMFEWIADKMPLIETIFNNVFKAIGIAVDFLIPIFRDHLLPVIIKLYEWVMDNLPLFQGIWEVVLEAIRASIDILIYVWSELLWPVLKNVFQWIQDNMPLIQSIFKAVFDGIKIAIDVAIEVIKVLWDVLVNVYAYIKGTFQNIGQFFKDAFAGITDFIQGIIDKVDNFIGKVKEAVDAVGRFLGGEKDFSNSQRAGNNTRSPNQRSGGRQGLAAGGTTVTAGEVLVGEAGPEVLSLPEGARVTPLSKMDDKSTIVININADNVVGQNAGEELAEIMIEALEDRGVFA